MGCHIQCRLPGKKTERQAANHDRTLFVKSIDRRHDKQHHVDLLLRIKLSCSKGRLESARVEGSLLLVF